MSELNVFHDPVRAYLLAPLLTNELIKFSSSYSQASRGDIVEEHPIDIAQRALTYWNTYLDTNDDEHRKGFLEQASKLLNHEVTFPNDVGGWPALIASLVDNPPRYMLSALMQSYGISVLIRAYHLTQDETFIQGGRRAIRAFELDILDGGLCSLIGENGIFFEEIAVYPATHQLASHILVLMALYDYVAITKDNKIEALIQQGLSALETVLEEFDSGYWTYGDLEGGHLTSRSYHMLSIRLLERLAIYSNNSNYANIAARWAKYQYDTRSLILYQSHKLMAGCHDYLLKPMIRRVLLKGATMSEGISTKRVCVSLPVFPTAGGMRSVIASVAHVMQNYWKITYLTNYKGRESEGLDIEEFGPRRIASPWHFPNVWFYCLAGGKNLISLLRQEANFQLLLPQDGVFSAAFTSLIGKLVGIRVVAMDHGNLTLLENKVYETELIHGITKANRPHLCRLLAHLHFRLYRSSLKLLARISARCVDHFLIPGIEGDEETEACTFLEIKASRISRYPPMIDIDRYDALDQDEKVHRRIQCGIEPEAIVIAMICRLAPEKGIEVALEAVRYMLSAVDVETREHVRFMIGGDGPLRYYLETQVQECGLSQFVTFCGELSRDKVSMLLSLSDISLYTSLRGVGMPLSILEAMASSCAVVASPLPLANVQILANGCGIVVPAGDAIQTGEALTHLVSNTNLRRRMGQAARDYVARYHSPEQFRRVLMRVTGWSQLENMKDILG